MITKTKVTTKRFTQHLLPFQGKIVFTLKGEKSQIITSFIPEVSIFSKGIAISFLVPNSSIEFANTYYHYAIYPQGHKPGVFFSEPVEEGTCIVPTYDCELKDIISNIPNKDVTNEIIVKASSLLATIRTSLNQAQQYIDQIKSSILISTDAKAQILSLFQQITQIYNQLKDKESIIQDLVNNSVSELTTLQTETTQNITTLVSQHITEFVQRVNEEKDLLQNLWQEILTKFATLETYQEMFDSLQEFQQQYAADLNNLAFFINFVPQVQLEISQIQTNLTEKQDQMLEITNFEILDMINNH